MNVKELLYGETSKTKEVTEGYAIKTTRGNYLHFQQIGDCEVEVFDLTMDSATLFNTEEEALISAKEIKGGSVEWAFHIYFVGDIDSIVKIRKEIAVIDEIKL